ncbi:MAG: hypothetical protein HUU14_07290 [Dehalococcoidia bacterium]|nr:hypothetical protein [Dehalococcoidia bacterium]
MQDCFLDLYWLPVAAGKLSPPRKWSLAAWEAIDAALHRRARGALYHCALKARTETGETYTIELTPHFAGGPVAPAMTGSVGFRLAGRSRFFRYQLLCMQAESLPDEEWAVTDPVRLPADGEAVRRVLAVAPSAPPHTWGRRVRGTHEMWTSNSTISWLLLRSGVDAKQIDVPVGGRAPGWSAGIEAALSSSA